MDTVLLNQYIFADMLEKHAQRVWKKRTDSDSSQPLTIEDFKEGFENLQWYRSQALTILENPEEVG